LLRWFGVGGALGAVGTVRFALADAAGDGRLVIVIQRGAMDSLAAIPPYGDPFYADRRKGLALAPPGEAEGIIRLDGTFGLHPALTPLLPIWQAGELAIVPATSGGYQTRSHFDAQDLLESGLVQPHGVATGWLNRALGTLPHPPAGRELGLAMSPVVPLMLRGDLRVASWDPPHASPAAAELIQAIDRLYAADPLLGPAFADGLQGKAFSDTVFGPPPPKPDPTALPAAGTMAPPAKPPGGAFGTTAAAAGKLLAAPGGPRVAVLEIGGWDTHYAQGAGKGRLADALAGFAAGLSQLRAALGPAWRDTVVVSVTEFGRTVMPNGSGGTDHGTASATLVLGGAVRGGRLLGDWPGLAMLLDDRDLRPVTDIRAVLKGVLRDHLGIDRAALDNAIFPGSGAVKPLGGLIRA
jgi:uncharacterized protein (DUF1501 family)